MIIDINVFISWYLTTLKDIYKNILRSEHNTEAVCPHLDSEIWRSIPSQETGLTSS
jgi:hypothetical protein